MAAGALMTSPSMKLEDGSFPTHNKKLSSTGLIRNVNFSHRRLILPVFLSSSNFNPQDLQTEQTLLQDFNATSNSSPNHVQVRFKLQRECIFGERFHIVGDDPKLGSWDPTISIPMDWSEGHVWTVKLDDIPAEKEIQFKFILKDGGAENIYWQPGPDRILQTWVTDKTITVFEDWDDPQLQTIYEEDLALTNDLVIENEIGDSITEKEAVVEEEEELVSFVEQDLISSVVFENSESIEDDILVLSESSPVLVPGLTHEEEDDDEDEDEDTMKDQIIQPNDMDEGNGSCSSNEVIENDTLVVDQLILIGDEDLHLRTEIVEEHNREGNVLPFASKTLKKFLSGFGFLRKLST